MTDIPFMQRLNDRRQRIYGFLEFFLGTSDATGKYQVFHQNGSERVSRDKVEELERRLVRLIEARDRKQREVDTDSAFITFYTALLRDMKADR